MLYPPYAEKMIEQFLFICWTWVRFSVLSRETAADLWVLGRDASPHRLAITIFYAEGFFKHFPLHHAHLSDHHTESLLSG
jgi:hypothetical protein